MKRQQFIYFIEPARPDMPLGPTPEEQAIVGEHFQYLTRQFEDGHLVLAGRTLDSPFIGIVIFEAEDEADAQRFAETDPGIRQGVFTMTRLQPYSVALVRT